MPSHFITNHLFTQTNRFTSSSSCGFSLLRVATARQYSPFHLVYFVSFPSSNPFHVFSHQIHPPSPWPSSFPYAWHRHLHHSFPHVVFFSPFYVSTPALHSEVCLPALQFSQSLSRIRFLSCPFLSLPMPISPFSTLQLPFFPSVFPSLPPFPFHKVWLV